ncbi:alpha/beta hydrolase family protein [Novosphingobium naphthalenivorans]|uniref:alpha/beta hydrolase family protein n=1 Tax=Novosphingobium naphthalenivorans TaxID=273168 RepID=UPI0009FF3A8E|nr:dienelactone hydrolase [Novosphingobium naphthalenivorans]
MRKFWAVLAVIFVFLANPAFAAGTPIAGSSVGFQRLTGADGTEIGIWYPSAGEERDIVLGLYRQQVVPGGPVIGQALPLVVMSHGNGGSFASHADTAKVLAKAGFIVAALTHPGDNWKDQSKATAMADRPVALSRLIDFMLGEWTSDAAIDPDRIGAFGFSSGGFTVLAAAGGVPDFTLLPRHCAAHPESYDCRLLKEHPRDSMPSWPAMHDPRIKALVVAAPALGFTFTGSGLKDIRIPVQLWRADDDHILPAPDYADAVRAALPTAPQFHSVPGADHFDFLAPCNGPVSVPAICAEASGFDRVGFHRQFNSAVAAFFTETLARP